MTHCESVCIVGLGLMGGSFALALKKAASAQHITAVSRSTATLEGAIAAGAIDEGTTDLAAGIEPATNIVLATPVRTTLRLLRDVGRHAHPGALVLDMGSTKVSVCAAMEELPVHIEAVGGHPMCGKEIAGFGAAEAGLFRDKPFALCRLSRTSSASLERATALVEAVGARPLVLGAAEHDRAVAAVSHLPYAVAVSLVAALAAAGDPIASALAASGYRDTTRIAASDVEMMLDILLTNRGNVLECMDEFGAQLAVLREALHASDEPVLRRLLANAQARRSGLRLT